MKKQYLNEIEQLKKKLNDYKESNNIKSTKNENKSNNNNLINNNANNKLIKNGNSNNNKNEKTFSKWFSKDDIENINSIIPNSLSQINNLNYCKNLKNLFTKNTILNNKLPSNYNIIKNLYMNSNNSNRNYINSSIIRTINTNNVFTSIYNKIINNINHKKIRHGLNKKYRGFKQQRKNNSISMKIEKEEEKSLSVNKYIKSNNDKYLYKSDRKKKNSIQINFKQIINYPLSCKNKTSSKLQKFKNNKIGLSNGFMNLKTRKNNSALNIRINSK